MIGRLYIYQVVSVKEIGSPAPFLAIIQNFALIFLLLSVGVLLFCANQRRKGDCFDIDIIWFEFRRLPGDADALKLKLDAGLTFGFHTHIHDDFVFLLIVEDIDLPH